MRKYITKDICEEWYKADAARFVEFEILIVAAVIGFIKRSLLVFGGVFFCTIAVFEISKTFARILCFAMSLCWGFIGYAIGAALSSSSVSVSGVSISIAGVVLSMIAFSGAIRMHSAAIEWTMSMMSETEE